MRPGRVQMDLAFGSRGGFRSRGGFGSRGSFGRLLLGFGGRGGCRRSLERRLRFFRLFFLAVFASFTYFVAFLAFCFLSAWTELIVPLRAHLARSLQLFFGSRPFVHYGRRHLRPTCLRSQEEVASQCVAIAEFPSCLLKATCRGGLPQSLNQNLVKGQPLRDLQAFDNLGHEALSCHSQPLTASSSLAFFAFEPCRP